MRIQLFTLSAILSLATAQTLTAELPCATSCIASAVSAAGCAPNDQACQCGPTQSAIGNLAAPCLLKACPASELGSVVNIGSSLCAQYSAGLTGSMTTAGMSATGPVNSTAMTTASGETTAVVVVTSSGSATAATGSSSASSAGGSSGSGGSSSAAGGAPGTSSAAATSASKAAAVAGIAVNGMGGLAAAFFGVVAAF